MAGCNAAIPRYVGARPGAAPSRPRVSASAAACPMAGDFEGAAAERRRLLASASDATAKAVPRVPEVSHLKGLPLGAKKEPSMPQRE